MTGTIRPADLPKRPTRKRRARRHKHAAHSAQRGGVPLQPEAGTASCTSTAARSPSTGPMTGQGARPRLGRHPAPGHARGVAGCAARGPHAGAGRRLHRPELPHPALNGGRPVAGVAQAPQLLRDAAPRSALQSPGARHWLPARGRVPAGVLASPGKLGDAPDRRCDWRAPADGLCPTGRQSWPRTGHICDLGHVGNASRTHCAISDGYLT